MDNPTDPAEAAKLSPTKIVVIVVVALGGIIAGTILTLPKMDERGRSQERYGRSRIEQPTDAVGNTAPKGTVASSTGSPLIMDGDFLWVASETTPYGGYWINRHPVREEAFASFREDQGIRAGGGARSDSAVQVTPDVALMYCDWLKNRTELEHRLPTEQERNAMRSLEETVLGGGTPPGLREWVTLGSGAGTRVTLVPAGDGAGEGAFRVVRIGPSPGR